MRPQSVPATLIVLGIAGVFVFNDVLDVLALTFVRPGEAAAELPMRLFVFFFVVTLIGYRLRSFGLSRITEWATQSYASKTDPARLEIDPEEVLRKTMSGQRVGAPEPFEGQRPQPKTANSVKEIEPAPVERPSRAPKPPKSGPSRKDRSVKSVSDLGPKRNDRFSDSPIVSSRRSFFS